MAAPRLQVFHAVAKHLSFTKAADALFMTQPAVTFQIKQLEEYFSTRLFDRAQGRITLTPAGSMALEYAERILDLSAELEARLKEIGGQDGGSLLQHPYISREAGSGTRAVIDRYLQEAGVAPDSLNAVVELGSPEALKGLVATGLGFAIMSRVIAAKELELGQLVQIPLRPPLLRNFSVVYPKERFHSKLVSSFLQFARVRLAGMHPPGLAASAL